MSTDKKTPKEFTTNEWIATCPENYDLSAEFKAEISPLLAQILEKCVALDLPFVAVFGITCTPRGGEFATSHCFPSPERAPSALLLALEGAKCNIDAIDSIVDATADRMQRHAAHLDIDLGIKPLTTH